MKLRFLTICVLGCIAFGVGCTTESKPSPHADQSNIKLPVEVQRVTPAPIKELLERDYEIIRFVLAQSDEPVVGRITFLTSTSQNQWGAEGNWNSLPGEFHATLDSFRIKYRPSEQAHFLRGYVFENATEAPSFMVWVTVKQWISATEVEVETGSWSGPLDAAGSTIIYEKKAGQWMAKTIVKTWES